MGAGAFAQEEARFVPGAPFGIEAWRKTGHGQWIRAAGRQSQGANLAERPDFARSRLLTQRREGAARQAATKALRLN
jgi:hypothetical protein